MKLLCNEFCSIVVPSGGVVTAFMGNEVEVTEADAAVLLETGRFTPLEPIKSLREPEIPVFIEKEIPQTISRAGKSKKKLVGDNNG